MSRQKRRQMRPYTNGPHAGPAAAMRNAKCFVQIHMHDIGADMSRESDADHGVKIRAVHVYLSATIMNNFANLANFFFKHTMCRWIGDHQRRQAVFVLIRLGDQISDIDVAVVIAGDNNNFHPSHHGGGWISTMRRRRDQADGAIYIAPCAVIGANDQ